MSEALDRLLMIRFMGEAQPHVPDTLKNFSADPTDASSISWEICSNFESQYKEFRTNEEQPETTLDNLIYIVDLMALIRTMRDIPEIFEDLAFRIIKSIPSG